MASFLGRRHYTRYDLEDAVGQPLAAATGLPYHSRRGGLRPPANGLSWRVTVADDRALVALRIGGHPLRRRPYRRVSRPGSLHPPLAAAMVRLAWNRQVRPSGILARRPQQFWRELRRVLRPGGRAVLLLPDADARLADAAAAGLVSLGRRPVSVFGAQPEVVTLSSPR